MKLAIVLSRYHPEVISGLLKGALQALEEMKIPLDPQDIFEAPGAFEIPLVAQQLSKTRQYDGIICLGCVIQGETAHFEFISLGTTLGLMLGSLITEIPLSFGILTTHTEEQAIQRSQATPENKGREAAIACVKSVQILAKISKERLQPH